MNFSWKAVRDSLGCAGVWVLAILLAGCATSDVTPPDRPGPQGDSSPAVTADLLRIGDTVTVIISNIPNPGLPHEERIKEDGTITLQYIGAVVAVGKTAGQLQKELQDAYVPKYYRNAVLTVKPPPRFFYVRGEVKLPNQYLHSPGMSVLKAITAAGGFTDFADRTKVELTRGNGAKSVIDCKKAQKKPSLDLPVYPDDQVNVPRRYW